MTEVLPGAAPVSVVAAVIRRGDGAVLLAQRFSGGPHGGLWEFPGGKVEDGETPRQALAREIEEELGVSVRVGDELRTVDYRYPHIAIRMTAFACSLAGGDPRPIDCQAVAWVDVAALGGYPMPAADRPIARDLEGDDAR